MGITRSNGEWVAELGSAEEDIQAAAIEALRGRLQRGVYYYLTHERSDMSHYSTEDLIHLSEDFAQDAVLRVLQNVDTFRGDSQFTTWAMKIAARVAVSELRRARYKDFSLEDLSADGDIMLNLASGSGGTKPPERQAEQHDVLTTIARAFEEALTEHQRLALQAVGLQGIPMDVVAGQLGINRNALYKLLHDARKKLKKHLEKEGLDVGYMLNLFAQ